MCLFPLLTSTFPLFFFLYTLLLFIFTSIPEYPLDMTAVDCGTTPAAVSRGVLASPFLSSPLDVTTPHTVVADVRASGEDRRGTACERRAALLASLTPFVSLHKGNNSTTDPHSHQSCSSIDHNDSKEGRQLGECSLSFSSPCRPLSSSHRHLLEIIQQQQERIVALQTSLLYATEFTRRTSHPFSFSAASEGELTVLPVTPETDTCLCSLSSLPASPLKADELAGAPATTPSLPVVLKLGEKEGDRAATEGDRLGSVYSCTAPQQVVSPVSLFCSHEESSASRHCEDESVAETTADDYHEGVHAKAQAAEAADHDAAEAAAPPQRSLLKLMLPPPSAPAAHRSPSTRQTPPRSSQARATSSSCGISVPRTHRVLRVAQNRVDRLHSSDVHVSVESLEDEKTGDDERSARDAGEELARLRAKVGELSAAHASLRVRCARRDCERRDTDRVFRAFMGCVQAALDAAHDDSQPLPQYAVSLLEYIFRQCSRSLSSVGGTNAASTLTTPLSSSPKATLHGQPTGAATPCSPSPAKGA